MADYAGEVSALYTSLLATRRDPFPKTIQWQTSQPGHGMFWIAATRLSGPSATVTASREGNTLTVRTENVTELEVRIPVGMTDPERPVRIIVDGKVLHDRAVPIDRQSLAADFLERHDRALLIGARIPITVPVKE